MFFCLTLPPQLIHTFVDRAKTLNRSAIYLSSLQSRFELPPFEGAGYSKAFPPDIQRIALRKLAQLHAVTGLIQLCSPPGIRLETLKGNRKGQNSIRINDQCRICFRWESEGPHGVEIVDSH